MASGREAYQGQRDIVALDDAREHALHLHHVLQLVVLGPHERKGACSTPSVAISLLSGLAGDMYV